MRVSVIGLGYVGLVTSACLAELGHEVVGVEVDESKLLSLRSGVVPFHEPGLTDLVIANSRSGSLRFTGDAASAAGTSQVVIVAVGTHDGNGGWQTKTINDCLMSIVPSLSRDAVLIVRSTLPPDFLRGLASIVTRIRDEVGQPAIPVLLNPEFTREGQAVRDFMEPDRVVIGVAHDPTNQGVKLARRLYRHTSAPILVMPAIDASMAKLGANLFLATKISFANELANLCDAFGADVEQVVGAMSHDRRIGGAFLRAGIGFGGSCLPHQVTMTVRAAEARGGPTPLLAAVEEVNHRQQAGFVERLETFLGGSVEGARIALLGLTFKPDTDDLREAPSLRIAGLLIERGATVVAYDPMESAMTRAATLVPGLTLATSAMCALDGADAAGLVTEWPEFRLLDWAAASRRMARPILVDGRNALSPASMLDAGFAYSSFGRGTFVPDGAEALESVRGRAERGLAGLGQEAAAALSVAGTTAVLD